MSIKILEIQKKKEKLMLNLLLFLLTFSSLYSQETAFEEFVIRYENGEIINTESVGYPFTKGDSIIVKVIDDKNVPLYMLSTDNGSTWRNMYSKIYDNTKIVNLMIHPVSFEVFKMIRDDSTRFKYYDFDGNLIRENSVSRNIDAIFINPFNQKNLIEVQKESFGIYDIEYANYSTDFGKTWRVFLRYYSGVSSEIRFSFNIRNSNLVLGESFFFNNMSGVGGKESGVYNFETGEFKDILRMNDFNYGSTADYESYGFNIEKKLYAVRNYLKNEDNSFKKGINTKDLVLENTKDSLKFEQDTSKYSEKFILEAFELCLPAGRKYTVDLILGTDTMGVFSACNRNFKTQIECDSLPKDCCEGIENLFSVVESHKEALPKDPNLYWAPCAINTFPVKYINTIKIDTSFSSDCFYSLAIDFIGDGRGMRTIKSGVGGNPIDFQSLTNGELPALEFYSCAICDSTLSYNVTKLPVYFLGRDGETICMDSIPIRLCCGNAKILDLNVSQGPTYKTRFETPSEDKFIEVNSENIHASIKPNPSNVVFNLEFESYLNQDIEIKVVDLYGNIYYKIDKDKYNKGYYSKTINLGNMSNGSYFVNLSGDKSNITIPIIIIMK